MTTNHDLSKGYKRKTISAIINNKINSWLKSIDDEDLQKEILNHYILTGGAIVSLLQGEQPNDYDIYFDNYHTALCVVNYYVDKLLSTNPKIKINVNHFDGNIQIIIKSAGIIKGEDDHGQGYDYFEINDDSVAAERIESYLNKDAIKSKKKYEIAMVTSNAISLTGDIQLIFRFIGNAEEIHKNYDFVHVTNYYTNKEGLVLNTNALESIMSKTLIYIGSLYPICSMFRTRKFIQRGWSCNAGEMLKIAFDINALNLKDMNVLYEQLVGVDAAYFHQLITMIKEFQQKNFNVDLGRSYLFQLINKVFNENDLQSDELDNIILEE